ncbi:MAG: formimidoylglutamate deiminase, partial [Acidimicrobiia bacterium]
VAAGLGTPAAIGRPEPAGLVAEARADMVAVNMNSPRTAGVEPAGLIFAATAADVCAVVMGGRYMVGR